MKVTSGIYGDLFLSASGGEHLPLPGMAAMTMD